MAENDKPKEGEKKETLLDVNVALVLAENTQLKAAVTARDAQIEELAKKLGQATDLIEQDTKSRLIAELKPKTSIPGEFLTKMSVEKLNEMNDTLSKAVLPAFKSGAPVYDEKKKPSLDGMFEDYAKTWRKS